MQPRAKNPLRDALFGLVVSAALLLVAELVLATRGESKATHLSRGFDPDVPDFVPDERYPGCFFTRYREDGPEVLMSPHAERMLMIGGSNVQGFPDGALREALR
ncbi:MAG: hypothetical protein GY711_05235 [bacterium]|nr:hypothetical protein [bacterium]